jgi:hypothetical protein
MCFSASRIFIWSESSTSVNLISNSFDTSGILAARLILFDSVAH